MTVTSHFGGAQFLAKECVTKVPGGSLPEAHFGLGIAWVIVLFLLKEGQ